MTFKTAYLFAGLATVLWATDGPGRLARDLPRSSGSSPVRVIVRLHAQASGAALKRVAARGRTARQLRAVRAIAMTVPPDALTELAADPEVEYVTPDRPIRAAMDYTVPATGADIARAYGWDGAGIGVAVIDSGIADVADLHQAAAAGSTRLGRSRVVFRESFVPGAAAADPYGHGTHVAGIIAGNGWFSTHAGPMAAIRGIAPAARLIDLRVLDENGVSTDSAVIAALERAIELKDEYNIRVINLSLGRPLYESYHDDPLCQAVEAAWKAGLTVVTAAGNYGRDGFAGSDGYWTITSPGNDPYAITVGAMKTEASASRGDDQIASYSSKGPTLFDHVVKPDLVAPGNRVTSLMVWPEPALACANPESVPAAGDSHYLQLSGTSMAAPVVSGAAALLLQQEPRLTPDQVKARLMKTAGKAFPASTVTLDAETGTAYRSQYDIFTVGAGYVDIAAAIAGGPVAEGEALSPSVVHDPAIGATVVTTGPATVWALSAAWGLRAVWGPQ
ncbi:MAG TPA: S8 family peptidase, partial [Bryobacteraceae bacterium]